MVAMTILYGIRRTFQISAAGLRDDVGGPERRDEGEANVVGRGLVIFGPEGEQMGGGQTRLREIRRRKGR